MEHLWFRRDLVGGCIVLPRFVRLEAASEFVSKAGANQAPASGEWPRHWRSEFLGHVANASRSPAVRR